jgi:CHAT domain-containing protein/Tfp pilus assembly protein PilF
MTRPRHREARNLLAKISRRHALPVFFAILIALAFFFAPAAITTLAATPQEQTQSTTPQAESKPVALEPGKPLERELKGGEKHTYEIRVESGLFLHAVAEQLGIDVALTLYTPDGKRIASMDSPNGNFGPEKISTIAEAPGIYKLEVASGDKNVPTGHYRVTVDPLRAPSDQDHTRISAERVFAEAAQLQAQGGADSLRASIQKYMATLPLWQSTGDVQEEALTRNAIGEIYCLLGEMQKSLDYFVQALPLQRATGDRAGEGATLSNIGVVYRDLGEKQKALDYFAQALPLERATGDRAMEATTLHNIGRVYNALGEKQKALDYYAQALPLDRATGDRGGEAATLGNIGVVYDNLGEKQKALDYYKQALPLARATGDRAMEATTLQNIGAVYRDLGEKQKALDYFAQALPLARATGDRAMEATTLNNIGRVYSALGEKQKALDYYAQALPLERATGDRSGEATTLNSIGLVYNALGEKQKALDYYAQALPLRRAVEDGSGEAATLNNIGVVYKDLGEKQKALDYYAQALPLERATGDRAMEATTLHNIGFVYDALGEKQKALDYYAQALSLRRAVRDRSGEAGTLNNIGFVYQALGENQKALEYYNQALALHRAVREPLPQAIVLGNLMRIWRKLKQPETAIFFGKQAVNEIQQVRSNIRGLEKGAQQSFLQSNEMNYRQLADILISLGRLSEAEQVLDLLKDEEYFQFVRRDARQAASLTAPVEFTKDESELNGKYEKRADSISAIGNGWALLQAKPSRNPEEEKQLADLTSRLDTENQAWSKFLNGLYLQFHQPNQVETNEGNLQASASRMQSVLRELGPGIVALYTLASEEKYRVILVTAGKQVAREYPIKNTDLNKKVAAFRETLLDPASDPLPKAQELYQILVAPVAKDLEDAHATTLMWSLDGVLRYLPLAALYDGHGYLVEKYLNVVFTPASIALLGAHPVTGQRHGLGLGVSKSYGGMNALPAVPAELRAIIREAGATDSAGVIPGHTLLDDTFTTDNFKDSLAQKYELVHIASHFVYGNGNDTDSYLLLGGKDAQGQRLTLADINDDPKISFNDVELLTLSACNTAINIPGDGHEVDGLGMLAQSKGARAVMATLWSVDDASTGILMQTFYRNWTTGSPLSKAEALRRAQEAFLHGTPDQPASAVLPYAHPYYWAPFILIGNWQ